jgi:hypothetical protein
MSGRAATAGTPRGSALASMARCLCRSRMRELVFEQDIIDELDFDPERPLVK